MVISPATVKTHVSRAMTKLGARDRAQLVVFAYESGLVTAHGTAVPRRFAAGHRGVPAASRAGRGDGPQCRHLVSGADQQAADLGVEADIGVIGLDQVPAQLERDQAVYGDSHLVRDQFGVIRPETPGRHASRHDIPELLTLARSFCEHQS